MRIGIDYTSAVWQGAGIGRYTRELVRAVVEAGGEFEYRLFYAARQLKPGHPYLADLSRLCAAHPNVRAVPIPLTPRRMTQLWQRLRVPLPVELFTGPLDLLHAPDFVLPPTRARTILTIHDLSFLVHPECAVPSMARYLTDAVPRSLRRADIVLADSEATRRDLVRLLGVDAAQILVVYPGVAPRFRPLPPAQIEPVRRRLGLPERFLLFVGTLEPRKNLVRLLEAFARLDGRPTTNDQRPTTNDRRPTTDDRRPTTPTNDQRQADKQTSRQADKGGEQSAICNLPEQRTTDNGQRTPGDLHLVIGGRRGWLYEDVFAAIERLRLGDRVRVLDFVDDNDLPALYNLAWAFAYPSIYEGFGLPALEALACGTPVVTSDNSSLPEVVGDAAVLAPAEDVDALAEALGRAVTDEALRARLRSAGPDRAQSFTWERAAQQVLACYRLNT